jgi:hypothetical protein
MKEMKKYMVCILLATGLVCNANAKPDDKEDSKDKKDKQKQEKVVALEALPAAENNKPFSVPDGGSTAILVGLSICVLGGAHRKWQIKHEGGSVKK